MEDVSLRERLEFFIILSIVRDFFHSFLDIGMSFTTGKVS